MKHFCFVMFVLLFGVMGFSQSSDEIILEGKNLMKHGTIIFEDESLLKARGLFERINNQDNNYHIAQYYIALTDYKLGVYYLQKKNTTSFKQYIESSQTILKSLLNEKSNDVESLGLLATVYGIQVVLNPELGPTYGSQSVALVSQALGMAPGNSRVLMFAGISKYNTPEFYGGSKTKALEYFSSSVQRFESAEINEETFIDWGYPEAIAWQGQAYENLGDLQSALSCYQKALSVEPDYSRVKYVLLPSLEKKLESNE